jgi:hypothetical protein
VIFNNRRKAEGLFSFNATKPGQYMLVFSNLKSRQTKALTVAFEVKDLNAESEKQKAFEEAG